MKTSFEIRSNATLAVNLHYEKAEVTEGMGKQIDLMCQNVSVKGFRKGKAPIATARKYVDPNDAFDKLVNKLLRNDGAKAIDEYKGERQILNFTPVANIVKSKVEGDLDLEILYVLEADVKIGKYKGLEIPLEEVKVSTKDVSARIDTLLTEEASLEPTSEAAAIGDTVNINFIGYVNGVKFDGSDATNYDLALGKHQFVEGFEEGLVGIKAGEKRKVSVTFPANYIADLASKVADFDVLCNEVKKVVKPVENDEFASSLEKYKVSTLVELKKVLKEEIMKTKTTEAEGKRLDKIFAKISKASTFDISSRMVSEYAESLKKEQESQAAQYGLSLLEFLKLLNKTVEELEAELFAKATNEYQQSFIIREIVKAEKMSITKEEAIKDFGEDKYEQLVKAYSSQPNFDEKTLLSNIIESNIRTKVFNLLATNN